MLRCGRLLQFHIIVLYDIYLRGVANIAELTAAQAR
jgi:hypothetical protein